MPYDSKKVDGVEDENDGGLNPFEHEVQMHMTVRDSGCEKAMRGG